MPEACGDKLQVRTRQHVLPCLQVSFRRMYFTCRLICAPLDKVIAQFGDKILLCHKRFFFFFFLEELRITLKSENKNILARSFLTGSGINIYQ